MVEGDATMSSYVDADGKPKNGLNISQRMCYETKLARRHKSANNLQASWRCCAGPTTPMPGLRERSRRRGAALLQCNVESIRQKRDALLGSRRFATQQACQGVVSLRGRGVSCTFNWLLFCTLLPMEQTPNLLCFCVVVVARWMRRHFTRPRPQAISDLSLHIRRGFMPRPASLSAGRGWSGA